MTTFRLDPEGNDDLLMALAKGFAEFGEEAAGAIRGIAPFHTGRYRRTINSTTFLENGIYSGPPIRGTGVKSNAQIWTVIYTTSKLGHLFELGTKARDIPKGPSHVGDKLMVWNDDYGSGAARLVHQPGLPRRPHFWPGFASVAPRAGEIIGHGAKVTRTRVNAKVM